MKSGEGNISQDALISQMVGIQPCLSFSRTNDGPVQWIQLLHALDQQDLLGWPLVTPLKVQMHKCEKCSAEYCSPVNYRRHIRVHRRSLNVDKESYKNRDLLGAFWDKISLDEAKETLSFKDVDLEGVPGSSIVKALTSFVRTPGFCALPQYYVKAGSVLLDVIQDTPSRLPISSHELFSVLDDASERTFLCGGTSASMQKYIFDGEAGKVGLEMKNLVACTSYIVEQNLVKAWIADKDAEALRCQKLLMEEEEAAQRRQAELLERKRRRKLRQKEQKTKEQSYEEKTGLTCTADMLENGHSTEASNPAPPSEGDSHASEDHVPSLFEPVQFFNNEHNAHIESKSGFSSEYLDLGSAKNVESRNSKGNNYQYVAISKSQVQESRSEPSGLDPSPNLCVLKPNPVQNYPSQKDPTAAPVNGSKLWSKKGNIDNGRDCETTVLLEEKIRRTDQTSCEVMIGSISVTVKNCILQKRHVNSQSEAQEQVCAQDRPIKLDSVTNTGSSARYWRHVSGHEMECRFGGQSGNRDTENDLISGVGIDHTMPGETCVRSCEMEDNGGKRNDEQPTSLPFSSHSARTFLAQRWKEVISGDHATLVLSAEPEYQGCGEAINDCSEATSTATVEDSEEHSVLGSAENRLGVVRATESSSDSHAKAKHRKKPKEGVRIRYIAKQEPLLRR